MPTPKTVSSATPLQKALTWRGLLAGVLAVTLLSLPGCVTTAPPSGHQQVIIVMDPLAAQLACACVQGYAQRDYNRLATYLGRRTGQSFRVIYTEDLAKGLREAEEAKVALIVGKQSVVSNDAQQAALNLRPIARLTGQDGLTTLTGVFVVKAGDAARTLADLKGRRILFGPADSDEKHAAALAALRAAGVPAPEPLETRPSCTDAALDVQQSSADSPLASVLSSYALPLLEGCGSIDKGGLRVIGETAPVPFVTAYVLQAVDSDLEQRLQQALVAVRNDRRTLAALESKAGFVPVSGAASPAAGGDWPGWRGPGRDGLAPALPERLPAAPNFVWKTPLTGSGLAGLAVANGLLVVAERDLLDQSDLFRAFRADTGEEVWSLGYPAPGQLDYGQSPRATPLLHEGRAYLLGAFGDLHCLELASGKVLWKKHLVRDFGAKLPKWGYASAPLLVGDKLIVNPGAPAAALVALDRRTGRTLWKAPGRPPAYASFIVASLGGHTQIVGYDESSLGGWDPATGRRLWTLVPPNEGDFNVPTPVACEGRLLVATENNGTRLYAFQADGTIIPKSSAEQPKLAPDVNSPVVMQGKVLGCHGGLYCLDLAQGLKVLWDDSDAAFSDFVSLIGSAPRLLVTTYHGELLLVSASADGHQVVSRLRLFDEKSEIYSHPALAGSRLFIRDASTLCCVELGGGPGTFARERQ